MAASYDSSEKGDPANETTRKSLSRSLRTERHAAKAMHAG